MGRCTSKPLQSKDVKSSPADAPIKEQRKVAVVNNQKVSPEPVNVIEKAPAPVTKNPYLATSNNSNVDIDVTQPSFKNFKSAVGRVMDVKRMWTRFWAQLDEAEERDLFMKAEMQRNLRDSLSMSGSNFVIPAIQVNTGVRVKAKKVEPEETTSRRRSYVRKTEENGIDINDVYEGYRGVPHDFLWDLTRAQHRCRGEIASAPVAKQHVSKKGKDYEVASLPPLDDYAPITQEWIDQLIAQVKQERIISYNDAFQIAKRAARTLVTQANVVDYVVPSGCQVNVIGDVHGQLDDVLMVFREAGKPTHENRILFNGDFVDRGQYSCECMLILLAYRAAYPDYVLLNRGNHECTDMNSVDGFLKEVELKYTSNLYNFFNHVFACLPVAHLITVGPQRIFVVHAGLSFEDVSIADINAENRFMVQFQMNSILQDLVWSDPYNGSGRVLSKRGAGCQFGADVCARFLIKNNVHLIIRSHECEDNGFALWFENRLYTIFSASDYCGDSGNYGAFCILSENPAPQIRVYMAKKQVLKYSDRQQRMRQMIMSKLLVRLATKIFDVEDMMNAYADKNGTISRIAWSYCLQNVLQVDAPYICIAHKLGVDLRQNRRINVAEWCAKFKPKQHRDAHTPEEVLRSRVSALLFDNTSPFKSALETLFAHFDVNSDGSISLEEFNSGLHSLINLLKMDVNEEYVAKLVQMVDTNSDGEVDYNEFFTAFAYGELDIKHEDLEVHAA